MGGWVPLDPDEPVVHVSWFEADAFARAHGARLPTEAEWEKAATWDQEDADAFLRAPPGARQPRPACFGTAAGRRLPGRPRPCGALGMLGDMWEWTSSDFDGYPGFAAHPYREYSEVFFGAGYKVLRGGSWATRARVANADLPQLGPPPAAADLLRRAAGVGRMSWSHRVNGPIRIDSWLAEGDERTLADDVLDGLTRPFKELPPKHFYDARGSELFDQICELPEYYPTRTERAILEADAADDRRATGAARAASSSAPATPTKTRVLLDAMADAGTLRRYVPFDVAESVVRDDRRGAGRGVPGPATCTASSATSSATSTGSRRPDGPAHGRLPRRHDRQLPARQPPALPARDRRRARRPTTGSCSAPTWSRTPRPSAAPTTTPRGSRPSSTATSCTWSTASWARTSTPTASSTSRLFDAEREWIEMRLRALRTATVTIAALDLEVAFAAGEEVRTEISAKFTRERLEGDYAAAGLRLTDWWTDPQQLFALSLAAPR